MATYMTNCLYLIQSTVALYEFTDTRVEMLQAQIDAHVDTLVSEQATYVLNQSGMTSIYGYVQQHQHDQGSLSSMPGMDPASIKSAMSKFDSYLGSPDSFLLPQTTLLLGAKLRETVKTRSVQLICQAYNQIYAALTIESNAYPDPRVIAPRTPEQVTKLLS